MNILTAPHQLLKTRLAPIDEINDRVSQDANSMLLVCRDNKGLGLSANQVGLTYRMFVIPALTEPVCINPVIVKGKNRVRSLEGCLSLPNYSNVALRYSEVRVEYYNLDGVLVKKNLSGQNAFVFQHELDHLNGILLTDKQVVERGKYSSSKSLIINEWF